MNEAVSPIQIKHINDIRALVGHPLGPSAWLEVSQADVDAFGRAVHDWHWAHNDPELAAAGPFGIAIAHAHMTLSMIPHLREGLFSFASGECMFYGYNRVRFPTAVPVGSQIRAHGPSIRLTRWMAASRSPSTSESKSTAATVPAAWPKQSGDTTTSTRPREDRLLIGGCSRLARLEGLRSLRCEPHV